MAAPPTPTIKNVWARDLAVGDRIINVGRVEVVKTDGVFVIAQVRQDHWSLATGGLNRASLDIIRHCADVVGLHDNDD